MIHIEDRRALAKLAMALNFAAKPSDWVRSELKTMLTAWCIYRRNREEIHDSMNSWDCGRQDAWYDSFDHDLVRMQALRLARKIQRGSGQEFKRMALIVVGE